MISIFFEPNLYGWNVYGLKQWISIWQVKKTRAIECGRDVSYYYLGPVIIQSVGK